MRQRQRTLRGFLQYFYSVFSDRNACVGTHKTTVIRFPLRTAPSSSGITALPPFERNLLSIPFFLTSLDPERESWCNNNKNVLAGAIGRDASVCPATSADDTYSYGTVHAPSHTHFRELFPYLTSSDESRQQLNNAVLVYPELGPADRPMRKNC